MNKLNLQQITTIGKLLLFTGMMTSCNRYYYQANPVNAPILSEAKELHVSANSNFGESENNDARAKDHILTLQAAYAPVKHLGVMAGYTNYKYKYLSNPNPQPGDVDASAYIAEAGVGGYITLLKPASKLELELVLDLYAGAGMGNLKSDVDMKLFRSFLQPGIGLKSKYFDIAFNPRIAGLKFSGFDARGHDEAYLKLQHLIDQDGNRIDKKTHYFFEPAFTLRGGYSFVKAQLQVVTTRAMSDVPWRYEDNTVSFGLYFELEQLLGKKL